MGELKHFFDVERYSVSVDRRFNKRMELRIEARRRQS